MHSQDDMPNNTDEDIIDKVISAPSDVIEKL